VKKVIRATFGKTEVGESGNVEETLMSLRKKKWDILLLDIHLPGRSGLDAMGEILKIQPDIKVIVLSMLPVEQYAVSAIQRGAFGFLSKSGRAEELPTALKKVMKGEYYLPPEVTNVFADFLKEHSAPSLPHTKLSEREFEILVRLAKGKTVGSIANEYDRSIKTISTHRKRILEKLKLKNEAELAQYCIRHGLI
jgi:DNA-binding NarL/FixJ family response regulator